MRLEKIRDAWDDFQARRARDAVYGYLEAVFAIVEHYRTRRRLNRLLRHTLCLWLICCSTKKPIHSLRLFATARCASDIVDNKTISKWARALRYAARCKEPGARLKAFMKQAGGVNACADLFARYFGRGAR